MVETNATIRLKAIDVNVVSVVNDLSAKITNAQIAVSLLSVGFRRLEKASRSSTSILALGARNADTLASSLTKAATLSGNLAKAIAPLSNSVFVLQQLAIATDGVYRAGEKIARLPQALDALVASGINGQIVQEFANIGEAIRGNEAALDSLVTSSIARLGQFEAAATRAGTILRSSTNFDDGGNALRANFIERTQNALSVQKLVGAELKNSISSIEALSGQYEVLSSGFTKSAESQEVLSSGLKLIGIAKAGGESADPGATLQLLTKTLNAYELSASQSAATSAKLNAIVENGLTTIQELSLGFGATAKQAKQANIDLDNLAASVSTLTVQGVSTPEALTGIARVASSIVEKTPEAEKALQKLQLNGQRIRFDKAEIQTKGFTNALIDLYEAAGGSQEILAQIFNEDVALRTVNALLAERGKTLARNRDAIASTNSASLQEVFDIATSDRFSRFEQIANKFQEAVITLGLEIAPTLEPGINALEAIANQFQSLPDPIKKLIGQYLALQIRTKAYGGAAKTLAETLAALAGNYLLVRGISLALTGQLGNEIRTIKDLITQRKGLAAATLQLFGINQKWRLSEELVSQTQTRQSLLTRTLATTRAKAASVTKSAITTGVGILSGLDKEAVEKELANRVEEAKALARATVARVPEAKALARATVTLGQEVGSALVNKGKEKAKEKAKEVASSLGVTLPVVPIPAAPTPRPIPKPVVPLSQLPPAPPNPFIVQPTVTDRLIAADTDVSAKLSKQIKLEKELEAALLSRRAASDKVGAILSQLDKEELVLLEKKAKAIEINNDAKASSARKTKALTEVEKQQALVSQLQTKQQLAQLEYTQANTTALVAENRAKSAAIAADEARIAASKQYEPLAKDLARFETANAKAIALSQQATVAKYEAEQIAILQGADSKEAIAASLRARRLESEAIKASEVALARKNILAATEVQVLTGQRLAEQGLIETRLFGNKILVSKEGLVGRINLLLATSITLTKAQLFLEKSLAKAILLGNSLFDVRNLQLIKLNAQLGLANLRSFTNSIAKLTSSVLGKTGGLISSLLKPLGLLAPLFGVATLGAIALRKELFGVGKESRAIAKEYTKLISEQQVLINAQAKSIAESRISRFVDEGDITLAANELKLLQMSGLISNDALSSLTEKLSGIGDASVDNKQKVAEFRKELAFLGQEAPKIEKGIVDNVLGFFKSIPGGIANSIDFLVNQSASFAYNAIAPDALLGEQLGTSRSEISTNREADRIQAGLSTLISLQSQLGNATLSTQRILQGYNQTLAFTAEVAAKVAGGFQLSQGDLKQEEAFYKAQESLNLKRIQDAETIIKKNEELLGKIKTPELIALYRDRIVAATQEKEALSAENEALKIAREQITKYLTEELPAIKSALLEQSNPQLALSSAREKFNNPYSDGGKKLLKPLVQLRDEAFKLVGTIEESLSLGVLDKPGVIGESVAARELRAIRDEQISFYQDGKLKTGYRLALADRKTLSERIIELENSELKIREESRQLEIQKLKQLGEFKLASETEVNRQIQQLILESLDNQVVQKQAQIKELQSLGIRTTEQEIELEKIKLEQAAQLITVRNAKLNEELARLEFRLNKAIASYQQELNNSKQVVATLEQEKQISNFLSETEATRQSLLEKRTALSAQASSNELFNAQSQLKLAINREESLAKTIPIQRQQLEREIAITSQQSQQALIAAKIEEKEQKFQLLQLKKQKQQAIENGATKSAIEQINLKVKQQELQVSQAIASRESAEFQLQFEKEQIPNKRASLLLSQQLETIENKLAISAATRAEAEAQINRSFSLQSDFLGRRQQQVELQAKIASEKTSVATQELELAQSLTTDEKKREAIAKNIGEIKLRSLYSQLKLEAQVLAFNQKQQKLQLQRDKSLNSSALAQNASDIITATANLNNLKAKGASQQEIDAAAGLVEAQFAQRQALTYESQQIRDRASLLSDQQKAERDNFSRQSQLQLNQARVEALPFLPESQRKRVAERIYKDLVRGEDIRSPNLSRTIQEAGAVDIEVPRLTIPEIRFPDIESLKADVTAIASEFSSSGGVRNEKQINITTLNLDSPINISISGNDPDAIASSVESKVYQGIRNAIAGLE